MFETFSSPDPPESPREKQPSNPPPRGAENPLQGYFESLIVTIVLALFATTFLAQAFKIPSASMVPALLVGDHLLVNKFIFGADGRWYDRFLPFRTIRHGDVIVFKYPYEDHPYYVKRVIALPGDHLHITDQHVYVNGSLLKEPYAIHDPSSADPYMFNFPPEDPFVISAEITPEWLRTLRDDTHAGDLYVPAGQYFVLGDNRDHSSDSRYWGFVPRDAIVGQPMFVYWSVKTSGDDSEPDTTSVSQAFADLGRALLDIPFRTRWNRIFHEVH